MEKNIITNKMLILGIFRYNLVLEIQATESILKTGCSYFEIELGEDFTEFMTNRLVAIVRCI
jgi:hypothetical protein